MANRSLNRVILIGNLTRDPELKYTPTGTAVCTFGVATNRAWKTTDGQLKEETQYHRVVAWQKLAELCGKLLVKGRKVYLEGRLVYRTFTGRDGIQRTIAEIILDDFIVFGDGKKILPEEAATEESKAAVEEAEEPASPAEEAAPKIADDLSKTSEEKDEQKEPKESADQEKTDENVNPDDIPF